MLMEGIDLISSWQPSLRARRIPLVSGTVKSLCDTTLSPWGWERKDEGQRKPGQLSPSQQKTAAPTTLKSLKLIYYTAVTESLQLGNTFRMIKSNLSGWVLPYLRKTEEREREEFWRSLFLLSCTGFFLQSTEIHFATKSYTKQG